MTMTVQTAHSHSAWKSPKVAKAHWHDSIHDIQPLSLLAEDQHGHHPEANGVAVHTLFHHQTAGRHIPQSHKCRWNNGCSLMCVFACAFMFGDNLNIGGLESEGQSSSSSSSSFITVITVIIVTIDHHCHHKNIHSHSKLKSMIHDTSDTPCL